MVLHDCGSGLCLQLLVVHGTHVSLHLLDLVVHLFIQPSDGHDLFSFFFVDLKHALFFIFLELDLQFLNLSVQFFPLFLDILHFCDFIIGSLILKVQTIQLL